MCQPPVDICEVIYFTEIKENVHTIDIFSTTYSYIPCLVSVVSECSLILFNLRIIKYFNRRDPNQYYRSNHEAHRA